MCSVNFWHQQEHNSLFKGSIGHVTSWCKRPIVSSKTATTRIFQSGVRNWPSSVSPCEIKVFNPQAWDSCPRHESWQVSYLSTLPVFLGVSKFFIKSPGDFRGLFLDIVLNDILKRQRFLDISKFLYSGGWHVKVNRVICCVYKNTTKISKVSQSYLTEVLNFNENVLFRKPTFNGHFKRLSNVPTKLWTK